MIKREELVVLEEKMDALDPSKNKIYKFLRCEQANKIDIKRVMERAKKEIRKRLDHLTGLNLNDVNLMKAMNCQLIPVADQVMNVCNLGKGDLEELNVIVLRGERFLWKTIKRLEIIFKERGRWLGIENFQRFL